MRIAKGFEKGAVDTGEWSLRGDDFELLRLVFESAAIDEGDFVGKFAGPGDEAHWPLGEMSHFRGIGDVTVGVEEGCRDVVAGAGGGLGDGAGRGRRDEEIDGMAGGWGGLR